MAMPSHRKASTPTTVVSNASLKTSILRNPLHLYLPPRNRGAESECRRPSGDGLVRTLCDPAPASAAGPLIGAAHCYRSVQKATVATHRFISKTFSWHSHSYLRVHTL